MLTQLVALQMQGEPSTSVKAESLEELPSNSNSSKMNIKHSFILRLIDEIDNQLEINGIDSSIPENALLYEIQMDLIAQAIRLERAFVYQECI